MKVKEIMTENLACCTMDTPLQQVAQQMIEKDCGCIPVVESKQNPKLVGMVTDRDITCRIVAQGKDVQASRALDCMSTPVVSVTPDTEIKDCFSIMEANQIRRIAVVDDDGHCCGIVSQADIAQTCSPEKTGEIVKDISYDSEAPSAVKRP